MPLEQTNIIDELANRKLPTLADSKFQKFHKENPRVFDELVKLTKQAHTRGRKKIGIGMLFEVIRWNMLIHTTDPEFKMNNNYRSRYARLIMDTYPEFEGIFDVRELKS